MADRFSRAEAANDNSFVGLPVFAAAIVSGRPNLTCLVLPSAVITFPFKAARAFCARVYFIVPYLNNANKRQVAGNMARVSPRYLNLAAGSYLALRAAYVMLYINGTSSEWFVVLVVSPPYS